MKLLKFLVSCFTIYSIVSINFSILYNFFKEKTIFITSYNIVLTEHKRIPIN